MPCRRSSKPAAIRTTWPAWIRRMPWPVERMHGERSGNGKLGSGHTQGAVQRRLYWGVSRTGVYAALRPMAAEPRRRTAAGRQIGKPPRELRTARRSAPVPGPCRDGARQYRLGFTTLQRDPYPPPRPRRVSTCSPPAAATTSRSWKAAHRRISCRAWTKACGHHAETAPAGARSEAHDADMRFIRLSRRVAWRRVGHCGEQRLPDRPPCPLCSCTPRCTARPPGGPAARAPASEAWDRRSRPPPESRHPSAPRPSEIMFLM